MIGRINRNVKEFSYSSSHTREARAACQRHSRLLKFDLAIYEYSNVKEFSYHSCHICTTAWVKRCKWLLLPHPNSRPTQHNGKRPSVSNPDSFPPSDTGPAPFRPQATITSSRCVLLPSLRQRPTTAGRSASGPTRPAAATIDTSPTAAPSSWASEVSDDAYLSRKIRKFRTDKFDTWNKRKFWLMQLM